MLVIKEESSESNVVCFLASLSGSEVCPSYLIHHAIWPYLGPSTRIAVPGFMLRNVILHDEPEAPPGRL